MGVSVTATCVYLHTLCKPSLLFEYILFYSTMYTTINYLYMLEEESVKFTAMMARDKSERDRESEKVDKKLRDNDEYEAGKLY